MKKVGVFLWGILLASALAWGSEEPSIQATKYMYIQASAHVICDSGDVELEIMHRDILPGAVYSWMDGETGKTRTLHISAPTLVWASMIYEGRQYTDTVLLEVSTLPELILVHDTICQGIEATIGSQPLGESADKTLFYKWSTLGTTQYINIAPTESTPYTLQTSYFPLEKEGFINACYREDEVWVIVDTNARFRIIGPDTLCTAGEVELTLEEALDPVWSTGESGMSCLVQVDSSLEISVKATDYRGCRSTKTHSIFMESYEGIFIDAVMDTVCRGESVSMVLKGENIRHFDWFNGDTVRSITVVAENDMDVYCDVVLNSGCEFRAEKTLFVTGCYSWYFPSAFAPKGVTREYGPIGEPDPNSSYDFIILDRSGKIIFQTQDLTQKWDGKYKGKYVTPGVYAFYFKVKRQKNVYEKNGTITVVF